jgi:adenylate kinase
MQDRLSPSFHFLVINITASDDWLVERAEHRLVCRSCGRVYDESTTSLKNKGFCDICLEPLHRRADDSPEAIRNRSAMYRNQITPLIERYRKEKILIEVNGERKFDVVYKDVANSIEAHTGLRSH